MKIWKHIHCPLQDIKWHKFSENLKKLKLPTTSSIKRKRNNEIIYHSYAQVSATKFNKLFTNPNQNKQRKTIKFWVSLITVCHLIMNHIYEYISNQ